MRFAFLGHSHHRRTGSSRFLLDALRAHAEVEEHWLDVWRTGEPFDHAPLARGGFDGVVVWQLEEVARAVAALRLPNVTFFPMYDSCHGAVDSFWRSLREVKVVCFSGALHGRLQRLGLRSRWVRYFPDPAGLGAVDPGAGLTGFFWQRQPDLGWSTIRPLLAGAAFERITLHDAMDPGLGEAELPGEAERRERRIRVTRWFSSPDEARAEVRRHGVYFAPRLREGIGMSFLEAMAMGMLVVAPDRPTMNEYVTSGVNGLLYDPARPEPLDFTRRRELGARARETVARGHERWRRALPALLELLAAPTRTVPPVAPIAALEAPKALAGVRGGPSPSGRVRPPGGEGLPPRSPPPITVAVLVDARARGLEETLASVAGQSLGPLEVLVLERAARPASDPLRRRWEGVVGSWRAAPSGVAAMAGAAVGWAGGDRILFLAPGDRLAGADALAEALQGAPPDADAACGGWVCRDEAGVEELVPPLGIHEAWSQLRRGALAWEWLVRLPALPAVLWRTTALRREPFRTDLPGVAHQELLLRLARDGRPIHHALTVLCTTPGRRETIGERLRSIRAWGAMAQGLGAEPEPTARALERMRQEARGREPWRLAGYELVLGAPHIPGSLRELKRRLRARHARRAALAGAT